MDHKVYIHEVLHQHIQYTNNTYFQLITLEASYLDDKIKTGMYDIIEGKLCDEESKYFPLNLRQDTFRTPHFCSMPKVHKNKTPTPLRPVVSQCGNRLETASTYIYYTLQPFTAKFPSYVKISRHVIKKLINLG